MNLTAGRVRELLGYDPGRYCAQITCNGQRIHIGNYKTPEQANATYALKAGQLFGEFARL